MSDTDLLAALDEFEAAIRANADHHAKMADVDDRRKTILNFFSDETRKVEGLRESMRLDAETIAAKDAKIAMLENHNRIFRETNEGLERDWNELRDESIRQDYQIEKLREYAGECAAQLREVDEAFDKLRSMPVMLAKVAALSKNSKAEPECNCPIPTHLHDVGCPRFDPAVGNAIVPAVPKFGCGASRTALADDLRARGDELSLEAADFIDCAHRKQQRLVWWPDGRAALRTEFHDGGWNEHAISVEPKEVHGVRNSRDEALRGAIDLFGIAAKDYGVALQKQPGFCERQRATFMQARERLDTLLDATAVHSQVNSEKP